MPTLVLEPDDNLARRLFEAGQPVVQRDLGDGALLSARLSRPGVATHQPAGRGHGIRERTGCSVVAVERGDEVLVEFGPEFRFRDDDALYVCGSHGAVRRFTETFA